MEATIQEKQAITTPIKDQNTDYHTKLLSAPLCNRRSNARAMCMFHLVGAGLQNSPSILSLSLTALQRAARLALALDHQNWQVHHWHVFSLQMAATANWAHMVDMKEWFCNGSLMVLGRHTLGRVTQTQIKLWFQFLTLHFWGNFESSCQRVDDLNFHWPLLHYYILK